MSVNVTVRGNPISIKRGKMVTCGCSSGNPEFDMRRIMRLQQVREQSKEIAADVRNRVRKEKEKLLKNAEKKGEQDLKRWQTRKLLTLQQQTAECVNQIGAAHDSANAERDPNEVLAEQHSQMREEAFSRGEKAIQNQKLDNIQHEKEQAERMERLKRTRKIEDNRSALVSKIKKVKSTKKKKKKTLTTNVSIKSTLETSANSVTSGSKSPGSVKFSDGDTSEISLSESSVSHHDKIQKLIDDHRPLNEFSVDTRISDRIRQRQLYNEIDIPDCVNANCLNRSQSPTRLQFESYKICDIKSCDKYRNNNEKVHRFPTNYEPTVYRHNASASSRSRTPSPNNSPRKQHKQSVIQSSRQSRSRIRQSPNRSFSKRHSKSSQSSCTCSSRGTPERSRSPTRDKISSPKKSPEQSRRPSNQSVNIRKPSHTRSPVQITKKQSHIKSKPQQQQKENVLPYVPTTSLKSNSGSVTQPNKVNYYDHINRFTKEYDQPASTIEKIKKTDIEVDKDAVRNEEKQFKDDMQRRDFVAGKRGKKAIGKMKLEKDYKELLKTLPILQRQERLNSIRANNPTHHMDDNRLTDLERRRQDRIENVFEKYHETLKHVEKPLITIKPINSAPPSEDIKTTQNILDLTESPIDMVKWTHCDSPKEQEDLEEKQKNLIELLERVNQQKKLLLKEVSTLPPSSNLCKILKDDNDFMKLICPCAKTESNKMFISTSTSPVTVISPTEKLKNKFTKRDTTTSTRSDTSNESIKTKTKPKKTKRQKILIRNEETQTSPSVNQLKSPDKKSLNVKEKSVTTQEKSPVREDKSSTKKRKPVNIEKVEKVELRDDKSDKLCEIIIKMSDDSNIKISKTSSSNEPEKLTVRDATCECVSKHKSNKICDCKCNCCLNPKKQPTKPAHQFSKNGNDISTSTAYMSPPPLKDAQGGVNYYKNLMHNKPQQTNISFDQKIQHKDIKYMNPSLLAYIKKLLIMSRKNIDELAVSSVSEVSTPGASVVETSENNPVIQLQNLLQGLNLTSDDLKSLLSSSISSRSTGLSPVIEKSPPIQVNKSKTEEKETNYSEVLNKYQELTQACCKKINCLSSKIAEIRKEKEKILSPLSDKNDNSATTYLDLPKLQDKSVETDEHDDSKGSRSSNESSISQDTLDRYLLSIGNDNNILPRHSPRDENDFVPMLQGIPKFPTGPTENKKKPPPSLMRNATKYNMDIDMTPHELSTILELDTIISSKNISNSVGQRAKSPEEQVPTRETTSQAITIEKKVKSPGNKIELIAKEAVMHIVEPNPQKRKKGNISSSSSEDSLIEVSSKVSHKKVIIDPETKNLSSEDEKTIYTVYKKPESNKSGTLKRTEVSVCLECSDSECGGGTKCEKRLSTSHKKKDMKTVKTGTSDLRSLGSDASSSVDDMEALLRELGLSWAISTIRKTQEALALSSSSSAIDNSTRKSKSPDSSGSYISDKDLLKFLNQVSTTSTSNENSNISPQLQQLEADLNKEVSNPAPHRDRSLQRTSTPVQHSKSTDSKQQLFTGDSDISSVRFYPDDQHFLSIPRISLDTNRSLNKTKK